VEDESGTVRGGLAEKIAKLAPDLAPNDKDKLWKITNDALTALAKDQIVHVRQIMAEALKNVTTAPSNVIRILTHDIEASVAAPVLEFSPILSDDDLFDIIQQGAASDNLLAISRRETISHGVSDAIVGTDDTQAIAALLSNSSAQIREETLDDLIDRAAGIDIWHVSLVHRPSLPPKAPQKLAIFIADALVTPLESREDLDAETLGEIKFLVKERLDDEGGEKDAHAGLSDFLEGPLPMVLVNRLHTSGGLYAAVLMCAIQAEDYRFVLAGLVALSGLSERFAKRIFAERNLKGIVSLIWKADLPAHLIVQVQQRMARVARDDII